MTARMRSGRSGCGIVASSLCRVMRSSYANSVVPDSAPSLAAAACCHAWDTTLTCTDTTCVLATRWIP